MYALSLKSHLAWPAECWGTCNAKIWTITPDTYRFSNPYSVCISHILLFLVLVSFFFVSARASLARTAYYDWEFDGYIKKPLHCRIILSFQFIVLFRGGLSSEYQLVRNRQTPLIMVQIVLDLVTPSLFYYTCHTYFVMNKVLVAPIAHNLEFNFHLPLHWIEAVTFYICCTVRQQK